MEILINDLSLHGQFPNVETFKTALGCIMRMRATAKTFGRTLFCHRNMAQAQVTLSQNMPQVVQMLDKDAGRAVMQWLTTHGPFWEDDRAHTADDYLDAAGQVVTDSAVGEAAVRTAHGAEHHLVSFDPSDWLSSPVPVTWSRDAEPSPIIHVPNHWTESGLEAALKAAPRQVETWDQLGELSRLKFLRLVFSDDSFDPLRPVPFSLGAAKAILARLEVLNQFKGCFDSHGNRTAEGQRLYNDFFADKGGEGGRGTAWFSDSSDSEKSDFAGALTFKHPRKEGKTLSCPWHGKVRTLQHLRLHFSWPIRADEECFVVYVGPKLTKR